MDSIISKLPSGSVDIIGDIHGEYGALLSLLDRLGYDEKGEHPEGRRLVFVGDLIDRGPDSVSTVRLVERFVRSGRASAVLGNHELNVLLSLRKHGNAWFFGEEECMIRDSKRRSFQVVSGEDRERENSDVCGRKQTNLLPAMDMDPKSRDLPAQETLAGEDTRREIISFLETLPLVLERADLRVVHAAWSSADVHRLVPFKSAVGAFHHFENQVAQRVDEITDGVEKELVFQNENPVKVLTSGFEQRATEKFYAGGKWRETCRSAWWKHYSTDEPLVVFGHYWRRVPAAKVSGDPEGIFSGSTAFSWLGTGNAMCVDYSVGKRYEERAAMVRTGEYGTALGALRLPEKVLIFADGVTEAVHS